VTYPLSASRNAGARVFARPCGDVSRIVDAFLDRFADASNSPGGTAVPGEELLYPQKSLILLDQADGGAGTKAALPPNSRGPCAGHPGRWAVTDSRRLLTRSGETR